MSSQAPCSSHNSVAVESSSRRWNATPLEYLDISISSKRRKPCAFTCIDSVLINTSLSNGGSFNQLLDAQWKQVPVPTDTSTNTSTEEEQLKKRPRWQPPRRLTAVEEAALYTSPPRIRIGLNYQVEHLPVVGQRDTSQQEQGEQQDEDECSSPLCLWDPQQAEAAMAAGQDIEGLLRRSTELNIKMALMQALHKNNYQVDEAMASFLQTSHDSIEWTRAQQTRFESYREELASKDFSKIAHSMGCTRQAVLVNYYRWKKAHPRAYAQQKRARQQAAADTDQCTVCKGTRNHEDSDVLMLCDGGCHRSYHAVCVNLTEIPAGEWHCPHCRSTSLQLSPRLRTPTKQAITTPSKEGLTPKRLHFSKCSPRRKSALAVCHKELQYLDTADTNVPILPSAIKTVPTGMKWEHGQWVSCGLSSCSETESVEYRDEDDESLAVADDDDYISNSSDDDEERREWPMYKSSSSSAASSAGSPLAEADSSYCDEGGDKEDDEEEENKHEIKETARGVSKPPLENATNGSVPTWVHGPARFPTITLVPTLDISSEIYRVALPIEPFGFGLNVSLYKYEGATYPSTIFVEYRKLLNGQSGAAEKCNIFVTGDEIIQVDGVACYVFPQVIATLKQPTSTGWKHLVIRRRSVMSAFDRHLLGIKQTTGKKRANYSRRSATKPTHPTASSASNGNSMLTQKTKQPPKKATENASPALENGTLTTNATITRLLVFPTFSYFYITLPFDPKKKFGILLGEVLCDAPDGWRTVFVCYGDKEGSALRSKVFVPGDEMFMVDGICCTSMERSKVIGLLKSAPSSGRKELLIRRNNSLPLSVLEQLQETARRNGASANLSRGLVQQAKQPCKEPLASSVPSLAQEHQNEATARLLLVFPTFNIFSITLPVDPKRGYGIVLGKVRFETGAAGSTAFICYALGLDDEEGSAERNAVFVPGDEIFMVDGFCCEGMKYREVLELCISTPSSGRKEIVVNRRNLLSPGVLEEVRNITLKKQLPTLAR